MAGPSPQAWACSQRPWERNRKDLPRLFAARSASGSGWRRGLEKEPLRPAQGQIGGEEAEGLETEPQGPEPELDGTLAGHGVLAVGLGRIRRGGSWLQREIELPGLAKDPSRSRMALRA